MLGHFDSVGNPEGAFGHLIAAISDSLDDLFETEERSGSVAAAALAPFNEDLCLYEHWLA